MAEQYLLDWINSLKIEDSEFVNSIYDLYNGKIIIEIICKILNENPKTIYDKIFDYLHNNNNISMLEKISIIMKKVFGYVFLWDKTNILNASLKDLIKFLKDKYETIFISSSNNSCINSMNNSYAKDSNKKENKKAIYNKYLSSKNYNTYNDWNSINKNKNDINYYNNRNMNKGYDNICKTYTINNNNDNLEYTFNSKESQKCNNKTNEYQGTKYSCDSKPIERISNINYPNKTSYDYQKFNLMNSKSNISGDKNTESEKAIYPYEHKVTNDISFSYIDKMKQKFNTKKQKNKKDKEKSNKFNYSNSFIYNSSNDIYSKYYLEIKSKENFILNCLYELRCISKINDLNDYYLFNKLLPSYKDGYYIGTIINKLEGRKYDVLKGIMKIENKKSNFKKYCTFYKGNVMTNEFRNQSPQPLKFHRDIFDEKYIQMNWEKISFFLRNKKDFKSTYINGEVNENNKEFYNDKVKLFYFLYDLFIYYRKERKEFLEKNIRKNTNKSNSSIDIFKMSKISAKNNSNFDRKKTDNQSSILSTINDKNSTNNNYNNNYSNSCFNNISNNNIKKRMNSYINKRTIKNYYNNKQFTTLNFSMENLLKIRRKMNYSHNMSNNISDNISKNIYNKKRISKIINKNKENYNSNSRIIESKKKLKEISPYEMIIFKDKKEHLLKYRNNNLILNNRCYNKYLSQSIY